MAEIINNFETFKPQVARVAPTQAGYRETAVELPDRIGFPPDARPIDTSGISEETIAASESLKMDTSQLLLNVLIQPRVLELSIPTAAYAITSKNAISEYTKTLKTYGITMNNKPFLNLYALNEGSVSDGIANSYGPSFLGSTLSWYNSSTIPELIRLGAPKQIGEAVESIPGYGYVKEAIAPVKNFLSKATSGMPSQFTQTLKALGQGLRIDLPNIWQGSSGNLSYSFTIRLYNPDPNNEMMYRKYIIAPIVAILSLACPRSSDGIFYNRPFIAKVYCPGLFQIKEAAISNISIVKGGDTNDISFEQRPNSVDVRLSFDSLYPTLINWERSGGAFGGQSITGYNPDTVGMFERLENSTSGVTSPSIITPDTGPPTLNEYVANLLDRRDLNTKAVNKTPLIVSWGVAEDVLLSARISQNAIDKYNQLK